MLTEFQCHGTPERITLFLHNLKIHLTMQLWLKCGGHRNGHSKITYHKKIQTLCIENAKQITLTPLIN